jgi:hypothetical protein
MEWKGIPVTDGMAQQDRQSAALLPDYFNIDELSFENLLAMGAELAASIKYFNLNNEVDGDWGELFRSDEAVVMASILSIDLALIESDYQRVSSSDPDKLPRFMLDMAAKINDWYTRLSACENSPGELLAHRIATIISEKLASELHKLYSIARHAGEQYDQKEYSGFAAVWGLGEPETGSAFLESATAELPDAADMKRYLSASFFAFSSSISHLKVTTGLLLQQSLDSGQHEPAIGLFMVFLKLYEKAQLKLNTFTPRYLDFYYQRVLKTGIREQVPESFYLSFETRPGIDNAGIYKNTEFSAGKDASLNDIIYCADEDLPISDARVESLATFYLQHEELVSPEFELGAVTRIKSDIPRLPPADTVADMVNDQVVPWSLFGAEHPAGVQATSTDASMGFSIASATLLLAQGVRKINIGIELEPVAHSEIDTLVSRLLRCHSQQVFRQQFGVLFARYLLSFNGCLSPLQKSDIMDKADLLLPKNSSREIASLLSLDWQGLFYKLFKKIFGIKLTAENGWLDVNDYVLLPYSEELHHQKNGLRISFSLGREVEPVTAYKPVVHGGQLGTELPVLQCLINPQANFQPYSIFQNLVIASLQIDVDVTGVKNMQAYNQHGQLDPSKPFQPFGPLPGSNAYLIFGNYELARKQLLELKIHLDWSGLPRDAGGFDEYYQAYETRYGNNAFKAAFSALADGRWMPDEPCATDCFNLFETEPSCSRVAANHVVAISRPEYFKPIDSGFPQSDYKYDLKAMKGFYRLSLTAPASAFGHGEYAQLLSKVMTANARLKKPKPVPHPPYTPTLNGISLDYKARATITPSLQSGERNSLSEAVIHMHPFGVDTVYPSVLDRTCFLMPQYTHEGNLFIGLSGTDVSGRLSLLFHLSQDSPRTTVDSKAALEWFYLASNRWEKMSAERILSDTTHGFLETGIVTLNIPPDISTGNTVMPGDYFWLRVSTSQAAASFCSSYSIYPHALKVSKKAGAGIALDQDFAQAKNWTPVHAIPGVGKIRQIDKAFGGRSRESESARKVRISERLHHKNRALLPRDYEQLVLERFPGIYKVKCFNSVSSKRTTIRPGHVLIVVVPDTETAAGKSCAHSMINIQQLERIKGFVKNLCPEFVNIEVRNPVYEYVQIRCTVKFADTMSEGVNLSRLDRQISDYICPWKQNGYRARFGWSIRQQDIESYIRSLGYIEYVTNFSMLHITVDNDGRYHLFDTAKDEQDREAVIRPHYPWSLALPAEKHFIESIQSARSISPEVTGVDELAVGSTFIISGSSGNGEEE